MRNRRSDVQRHRAGRIEARGTGAIEVGRVQRLRRTAGIGKVEHDEIVSLGRAAHEREAVLELDRQARVAKRATVNPPEVFARDVDDGEVDLDQRHRLDRRIFEQLFRRAAVASPDDERSLRRRMRDRSGVNEVLVIEKFVLLRGHEVTVEAEQRPERPSVMHFDHLKWRLEALELACRADEKT